MRTDRAQATKLRLSGKSYTEIQRRLGIPKATLAGWFGDLTLPAAALARVRQRAYQKSVAALLARNRQQTALAQARALGIRRDAASAISALSQRELLLVAAALYWAEGHKRPVRRGAREVTYHAVSLTNSDPLLIRLFIRFLRECCAVPVPKLKASLRIFPHQSGVRLQRYWQQQTGIPAHNFSRMYTGVSISSRRLRPFSRLPYGVLQIRVSDTALFHRIMGYIEGLQKFV